MKCLPKILALAAWVLSSAQAQPWRALIVYTDYVEGQYPSGTNLHATVFAPLFDEMNDIYANSGADARAEIAGVIWDKTFTSSGSGPDLNAISYNTGGMVPYINLLDEYAADILILRDGPITNASGFSLTHTYNASDGVYSIPPAGNIGRGAFWIGFDYPWVWVHEAGHSHDATHCDGYRRVFDRYRADEPWWANDGKAGFNDVITYQYGNPDCTSKYDDGSHTFFTTKTYMLSNPSNTWNVLHPAPAYGWATYAQGRTTPTNHNAVSIHNLRDNTIRGYRNTPSNLTITASMSMEQFDYADFRSTGSVTIEPGFSAENISQMRITVGSAALTKHAVNEDSAPEAEQTRKLPEAFSTRVKVDRTGTLLTGTLPKRIHLSLRVLKITGEVAYNRNLGVQEAGNFQHSLGFVPKESGLYLFQVRAGENTVVRRVYWER